MSDDDHEWWSSTQVMAYLRSVGKAVSRQVWERSVARFQAPQPTRWVGRSPRWRADRVREWATGASTPPPPTPPTPPTTVPGSQPSPHERRYLRLTEGEERGWWRFLHVADGIYTVELPGKVYRELLALDVLAWVAGFEDARDPRPASGRVAQVPDEGES